MVVKKSIEEIYQKKTQREHVLLRSGVYIGEVNNINEELWVLNNDQKMIKKITKFSPGFLKIFDEILSNATDHAGKDSTCNTIQVNYNTESGEISVFNNGNGIPVVLHKEHQIYIPQLALGTLLSGSNFDDTSNRTTIGMNGMGATLTNIFSKKFIIETLDSERNLKYYQEYSDNMNITGDPVITKVSKKEKGYTKITFIPDFPRFKLSGLNKNIIELIDKRVIDALNSTNATIYLNDVKLKQKTFLDYIKLYFKDPAPKIYYEIDPKSGWEYAIVPSDAHSQVSFVNGHNTIGGGSHVNYIMNGIISKLKVLIETKKKVKDLKPSYIKDKISIFVKCTIGNPSFNSQSKETLTTNYKDFGKIPNISDAFIEKLYKSEIVQEIVDLCKFKENAILNKTTDGKKVNRIYIEKKEFEDALWAGTARGNQCTLILTEGLSACTFAKWGRGIIGVEKYGVYPLKGVGLNVRDASISQLINNTEINDLKQIIGLKNDTVYKNTNDLRYGKIMLLVDSDMDGLHISSLIMNFFHYCYPSLLKLNFLNTIRTPIVKATRGKDVLEFFNEQDYLKWQEITPNHSKYYIKYFKGLGTSKKEDAINTFKQIDKLKIEYYYKDTNCDNAIELAFEKDHNIKKVVSDNSSVSSDTIVKCSDKRKTWLAGYDRNSYINTNESNVSFQDFINKGLIHFSISDNTRSIPHLCDGLKPSQRKILYYMLHNNIVNDIKVAQLSGKISSDMSYHHGEASLQGAIVGMAQDFTGTNNINLLTPEGNFGSLFAPKDAASPRYIFTRLETITNKLFNKQDLPLLNYLTDDGKQVEPDFFLPIIPMILVNGAIGIGTGYSTNIPCFNPREIAQSILNILNDKETLVLMPYYRGFRGSIKEIKSGEYIARGIYKVINDTTIEITELPIGMYVSVYKEFLEKLIDTPKNVKELKSKSKSKTDNFILRDMVNLTRDEATGICFRLEFISSSHLKMLIDTDTLEKTLKLIKKINTSNMHLFNTDLVLVKYNTVYDIINDYFPIRLEYYQKRKLNQIKLLENQLIVLTNKCKFIELYTSNPSIINNKTKNEIYVILEKHALVKIDDSYDYLLNLKLWALTNEKIIELNLQKSNLEKELECSKNKTKQDLWRNDLKDLITTF
jgi:DNA topoisomerase-2